MKRSIFSTILAFSALCLIPLMAQASADLCGENANPTKDESTGRVVTTADGVKFLIDGDTARKIDDGASTEHSGHK